MNASNSAIVFEEAPTASKKEIVSSVDKKTMESPITQYDEPGYFFKGAILGLIFCVPFWAVIFWLIT